MKKLILALALMFPVLAFAEGADVGPDCDISWVRDPATAATVTHSTVYIATSPGASGIQSDVTGTTTTCSAMGLSAPGQYYARVTDSNTVGESVASNEVPFVLVLTVPGAPSLTVQ